MNMAVMEGPLSKWTNVVKGWQYRWFVLDDNAGLLSYYTSKDKMKRGSRRGCVRLKGAIIGIDDEDDSTFTITVDHKMFHFQARDADEREHWIEALETTIEHHSRHCSFRSPSTSSVPSVEDFDRKLAETDAYLQLLINQMETLEGRIEQCEDLASRESYNVIQVTAKAMIEAIKHSIVMLQISKNLIFDDTYKSLFKETLKEPLLNGAMHEMALTQEADFDYFGKSKSEAGKSSPYGNISTFNEELPLGATASALLPVDVTEHQIVPTTVPAMSYSSSEEEDFYDAEEDQKTQKASPEKRYKSVPDSVSEIEIASEQQTSPRQVDGAHVDPPVANYDSILSVQQDDDYYDVGSLESHGSIITHLLSQVRIGMDLTKVVLPTFILERKSLLEMYADFFVHADLFLQVCDQPTPQERIVEVVRWYMSAFHASRNSDIAKKPYNPIVGETFQCYYNVPGYEKTQELVEDGPIPWATTNNLTFIAEQVSHHPPISAFYAEHVNKRITLDGYIWTKSKFLGLSIGVHMIGQAVISLLDLDEEYIITFPNGYGRSILTVPWMELGGNITVSCAKTGYNATVDFLTKPFYGGKKHRISGNIFAPNEKKPFCVLEGEWNGVVYAKFNTGRNEAFVDTKRLPILRKQVRPRDMQSEFESRRLWQEVTYNLKVDNVEAATQHKQRLEQRQRNDAKERNERGVRVETKFFHEEGEHWVYDRPLVKRLKKF